MAFVATYTSAPIQYPWGWEVRFELRDEVTGRLYSAQSQWPTCPSADEMTSAGVGHLARISAEVYPPAVAPPEPEWTIICEDGTEVVL